MEAGGYELADGETDALLEWLDGLEQDRDLSELLGRISRLLSPNKRRRPAGKTRRLRLNR